MIDVESQIFTAVATALRTAFTGISVESTTTYSPSKFPCVCIEEADNYAYSQTADSGSNENHANVIYEVNVYSNKAAGSKSECKSILSVIDGVMNDLGFIRTVKSPVNMDSATKYRVFARYAAVISQSEVIYRR